MKLAHSVFFTRNKGASRINFWASSFFGVLVLDHSSVINVLTLPTKSRLRLYAHKATVFGVQIDANLLDPRVGSSGIRHWNSIHFANVV